MILSDFNKLNSLSKIIEFILPASVAVRLLYYFERKKGYKVLDTLEFFWDRVVKYFEQLPLGKVKYDKNDLFSKLIFFILIIEIGVIECRPLPVSTTSPTNTTELSSWQIPEGEGKLKGGDLNLKRKEWLIIRGMRIKYFETVFQVSFVDGYNDKVLYNVNVTDSRFSLFSIKNKRRPIATTFITDRWFSQNDVKFYLSIAVTKPDNNDKQTADIELGKKVKAFTQIFGYTFKIGDTRGFSDYKIGKFLFFTIY